MPCFWVYREVANHMTNIVDENSIYLPWVQSYSSEQFSNDVDVVISIFDKISENSKPDIQNEILNAFSESVFLELKFFDDSYMQNICFGATLENYLQYNC